MAIAGLEQFHSPDEVIDAMDMVGSHIDPTLRCTDTGGLCGDANGAAHAPSDLWKKD